MLFCFPVPVPFTVVAAPLRNPHAYTTGARVALHFFRSGFARPPKDPQPDGSAAAPAPERTAGALGLPGRYKLRTRFDRQVVRPFAGAALAAQELLDQPVFQRMERQHHEPASRSE